MNKELKKEWVDALRSGKYEQGQQYLNKDGKFCCLGVLCELLKEKGLAELHTVNKESNEKQFILNYYQVKETVGDACYLSREIADLVELTGAHQTKLISFNDDQNKSFHFIADWIEQNIEES